MHSNVCFSSRLKRGKIEFEVMQDVQTLGITSVIIKGDIATKQIKK